MTQFPNPAAAQQVTILLALATELLAAGQPADAIRPLRDAALLQPSNPMIQHDLGLAFLEVGRLGEAVAVLKRAIAGNPHYADAYFRLAIALEKLGDFGGAIAAYHRATELVPTLTEAWFRAGALVYTLGHRNEAIGCFRRAAATGGKTAFGRLGKARALLSQDRNPEAEEVLRQTLALDPGNAMAHDLLGNLLAEYGRFDEARDCFQRAIQIAPLLAGSYYDLVRCRTVASQDDGLLDAMEAAIATPGLEAAQRMRVHLAIGKAAEDLGDFALAMEHFDAADVVRRGASSFDSNTFSLQIDHLIARFKPELTALAPELGNRDATPILILGMPRSGTTLVEQIISMHPDVTAGGELHFWNERGVAWLSSGSDRTETPFLAQAASDYLSLLRALAPRSAARYRQNAVQLPLGRTDPLGVPPRDDHPLPPRCGRHRAVDPSNSFPSKPAVSDRRRRTGHLYPRLPATHAPLAERPAGGSVHRGRLRDPHPRAGTGNPAHHRRQRPDLARFVPAPRKQSAASQNP